LPRRQAKASIYGSSNGKSPSYQCGGTDGEDGPTDAAGAIVDADTWRQATQRNLDPANFLAKHDAYHFLEATAALPQAGLTQTNVMDVRVILVG
jgi:glycerate-2-kinase